ncbi:TetR/AcrR family transcriptional regulator [Bacillus salacetis]|uniref:TetR/AcrR family transcriptional regulator n=1 Tax=Bacillus salacetis TaxID=2315464 RepID=A0A3A1R6J3_9BACI|nr:TetR/AcrR family transcriptional regulator [Bacillus salacetis]RIW38801.1 TetR/AcrR family transcriptional regulator [Bacillus salacetis]
MNKRKQHVISKAHGLFIEKGFQQTSIQDILDYSGISKGTFYNYFSSKNELLIELFKSIYSEIEQKRNDLLISQDPSDIRIFIKQIEIQMIENKENKLIPLFEEVMMSKDEDLKNSVKRGQLKMIYWLHGRFLDIFGESKRPYLLDLAITFLGILHHNLRYYSMVNNTTAGLHRVVHYSVDRIINIAEEMEKGSKPLFRPELLQVWFPEYQTSAPDARQELHHTVFFLKQQLTDTGEQMKYEELLDFIQEELLHSKTPRRYIVESAFTALKEGEELFEEAHFEKLEELIKKIMN